MQYADIALPVKTATRQKTFTYRIPPALLADIRIGQRVEVPFYRRKLVGTIISLRATPPKIKGSFKEIADLAEPFALFDKTDLDLARQVAQRYGALIGDVLEIAGPKPAKRTIKKLDIQPPSVSSTKSLSGKTYGLYQPREERFRQYMNLINKAVAAGGQALVLFPTQLLAETFYNSIKDRGEGTVLIPPTQELTEHYVAWTAARLGQASIIIGTRKAIFTPAPNLRLIIVDAPSEYGYKEEQFPYYHALTVAKLRTKITQSNLIIGDSAPRLTEWLERQQGDLQLLKTSTTASTQITLVDTTSHRGLISDVLREHVETALQQKKKIALYFNRKGSGRFYRCLECETASYCPRCDTLLTVYEEGELTILRCPRGDYESPPPYRCPVCNSYKMGSVGLGVSSFAKIVAEHFPDATIRVIEKESASYDPDSDITITTAQLFALPPSIHFDLLAVFHVDQLLHGLRWDTNEEAYLTLSHLAERTHHILIHTAEVEHLVIRAFCQKNIDSLYQHEAEERQKHGYPPVQPVIRLTVTDTDKDKAKQAADTLYRQYLAVLPRATEAVLPPVPVGTGKQRGKYRYQLIIKSQLTRLILDNLPSSWQIDPEPTEL